MLVLEKRQRTLDTFCVAAAPRADVASGVPQPSPLNPPWPRNLNPQSNPNCKGKERANSSQPKPLAKKPKKNKPLDEPGTFTEEEVAKINKQTEDRILEMLLHIHVTV